MCLCVYIRMCLFVSVLVCVFTREISAPELDHPPPPPPPTPRNGFMPLDFSVCFLLYCIIAITTNLNPFCQRYDIQFQFHALMISFSFTLSAFRFPCYSVSIKFMVGKVCLILGFRGLNYFRLLTSA